MPPARLLPTPQEPACGSQLSQAGELGSLEAWELSQAWLLSLGVWTVLISTAVGAPVLQVCGRQGADLPELCAHTHTGEYQQEPQGKCSRLGRLQRPPASLREQPLVELQQRHERGPA